MDLKENRAMTAALVYTQLVANPRLIKGQRGKDLLKQCVEEMKKNKSVYDAAVGQTLKKSIVRGKSGQVYEFNLEGTVDLTRPNWQDQIYNIKNRRKESK